MVKILLGKIRQRIVKLLLGKEITQLQQKSIENSTSVKQLTEKQQLLEKMYEELLYRQVKYMHQDKYEEWLEDRFQELYGRRLDFTNLETFTEKMQWIKIYGADDIQTMLADKYLVKKYIGDTIGEQYVVPLLGVYDTFDEIDFSVLPDRFVIKTNHASKSNIIVKDKKTINHDEIKRLINSWLNRNQFTYGLEMHYKNIKPKIIIEEYLEFQSGVEDYKFYCFNGKPEYLLVIGDRYSDEKMSFYDMNFNKKSFSILPGMKDLNISKPDQFDEMVRLTRKVIKKLNYPFIRVDWYVDSRGRLFFGEFTFNPGAGWYFFKPEEYDLMWGKMIQLPTRKNKVP